MMRKLFTFVLAIALGGSSLGDIAHAQQLSGEIAGKKIYECTYLQNAPYGVTAWAQSDFVRDAKNKDTRFADYNSAAATSLALDATTQRDAEKDAASSTRETAIFSAYNEKGWYLYLEAEEPLINEILDNVVDPKSPSRSESYEIFLAPGLHTVPYYQIFTRPFAGTTDFYDWGTPHRNYRSLKEFAKVESLPLGKGFGTFAFVPWEALYDRLPLGGDYWRFSVIRWMPYGKAGGVSWGGKVHDTGNFGLLHFQELTTAQKTAIQKRMLRAAWFKFQASAKAAATFWSDEKIGDPDFYTGVLQPEIARLTALGESLGKPDNWNASTLQTVGATRDDWMEFDYKIGELREAYLRKKRFSEAG